METKSEEALSISVLTNFKVVFVRQRVLDSLDERLGRQNLLGHLVHGSLHTGTVVMGKSLEGDLPGRGPGGIELGDVRADLAEVAEALPLPGGIHVGAQDTIPGLLEGGVLVAQEPVELRASALEHGEARDGGLDVDAGALGHVHLDIAGFLAVADEGVRVGLAVNVHARPAVGDDVGVRGMDVLVFLDEVGAQDGAEELGGSDGVLLGEDVDGILNRVGSNNYAIVGLGVAVVER